MAGNFKSNRTAVEEQLSKNKAAALEALGMEFTHLATDEMDRLIYHAPSPPSAGPNYVRTGRLRSGQTHQVNAGDDEVVVGNNVDYAVHVHFEGVTRNWGGRPWMTNVINNNQKQLQDVIEAVLGNGFG